MAEELNMRLEPVRTVLRNSVNEITVCADLMRRTGVFYTMISITAPAVRREVARRMAEDGLFGQNGDFIGSFSRGEALNLVFLYRSESALSRQEALYATSFARRKQIAANLVVALAEAQIPAPTAALLLDERNLHIEPDLSIHLNYFLDFARWDPKQDEAHYLRRMAHLAFGILSRGYEQRHEGQLDRYPGELQAFYKKTQSMGFSSYSALLAQIRMIPDEPSEPSVGLRRLYAGAQGWARWVRAHSLTIFLALVVVFTITYAVWQIAQRLSYSSAARQNITYAGVEQIGDVPLGDEAI